MTSAVGVPVSGRMLGKRAPKHDKRTLLMASYLVPKKLVEAPRAKVWTAKCESDFGMMGNDTLGDCTCAAMGHMVQVWTANTKKEITVPDTAVIGAYEAFCGYKPDDPNTDQGGVELDVLNGWRATGIGGYKIDAFVALEPRNVEHVKFGIFGFGGIYTGFALPATAQNQDVWSVVPHAPSSASDPGSWGGHAVAIVGYDAHYLWCITWGRIKRMTWGFAHVYMDEAYAALSPLWYATASGKAPSGFDRAALQTDLATL